MKTDTMRWAMSGLGVMAALILLAVSAVMNFFFLQGLGKTPEEGLALGLASAAADALKALLPFFIAWAWRANRPAVAIPGVAVWLFFAGFSFLSALGFAAGNRGGVAQEQDALNAQLAATQRARSAAEEKLAALPKHDPLAAIEARLAGHKQNRRWFATRGCADATVPESRAYCTQFYRLKAEEAAAREALTLQAERARLSATIERLRARGAGRSTDPQVSFLSQILGGGAADGLRLLLVILIALLVEIGASLGLYLSTRHGEWPTKLWSWPPRSAPKAVKPKPRPKPVGRVEDFILEAPRTDLESPDDARYAAYKKWCAVKKRPPLPREAFGAVLLLALGSQAGSVKDG